jgi:hypothetical protein
MQMNVKFKKLVEQMPGLLQSLEPQSFRTMENLAGIPERGVYVFYDNDKALYVGRSNKLKTRLRQHCRESSTHNSATFAFNLAKEEMAGYRDIPKDITRKELEHAPGFDRAFYEARKRVGEMKVRVVQIDDQVTQALFEIYAALALQTPYNDFSTH